MTTIIRYNQKGGIYVIQDLKGFFLLSDTDKRALLIKAKGKGYKIDFKHLKKGVRK